MLKLFRHPVQPAFVFRTNHYYKKMVQHMNVSHFYRFRCEEHRELPFIVPDGAIDIIFACQKNPRALICGSVDQAQQHPFQPHTDYFGTRLLPEETTHLLPVSPSELINQRYDLKDLWPQQRGLIEEICSSGDFYQQIALFAQFDFSKALPHQTNKKALVNQLLALLLAHHGNLKINQLAVLTHYSRRYITQVFHEFTGFSLKSFCKVLRLQYVLQTLNRHPEKKLIEVAYASGFYDQAHFIKDFQNFVQLLPKEYTKIIQVRQYQKKIIEA